MTTRQELDRSISAWLEAEAPGRAPDDILEASRDRIRNTRQRRFWWPARRSFDMNNFAKVLFATAAVVAVAVVAINLFPGGGSGTGGVPASPSMSPTQEPSMSPTPEPSASLVTHKLTPFGPGGFDDADPRAASMTFTFDAPASWEPFGLGGTLNPGSGDEALGVWIDGNGPPDGAAMFFYRGGGLYSDPCRPDDKGEADIPVGPTVADFVTALVDHPSLDVTAPVAVTLAGYTGKYLDLLVPNDISECFRYRPMDAHIYAQGPGHRWHMWVLDVGGVRVLVETNDYAGTSAQRLAEEQAMIDSLEINP